MSDLSETSKAPNAHSRARKMVSSWGQPFSKFRRCCTFKEVYVVGESSKRGAGHMTRYSIARPLHWMVAASSLIQSFHVHDPTSQPERSNVLRLIDSRASFIPSFVTSLPQRPFPHHAFLQVRPSDAQLRKPRAVLTPMACKASSRH